MANKKDNKNFGADKNILSETDLLKMHVLDSIADVVLLHDQEGNFVYVNEAAYKKLGYTKKEFMSKKLADIDTPENAKLIKPRIKELLKKKKIVFETAHVHKKGNVVNFEANARIVDLGPRKLILSILRDITEHVFTGKELKESGEHYKALFQGLPVILMEEDLSRSQTLIDNLIKKGVKDLVMYFKKHPIQALHCLSLTKVTEINENAKRFFKVSSAEELTRKAPKFITKSVQSALIESFQKLMYGNKVADTAEITLRGGNGKESYFLVFHFILPGSEITKKRVIFSFIDINERKKMEQQLRKEHNLMLNTLNSVTSAIYIKDKEGRFMMANKACLDIFGISDTNEILGKTDFDFFPKNAASVFRNDEKQIIKSGISLLNKEDYWIDPKGNERWTLINKMPFYDIDGSILGTVGVNVDITEYKKIQQEMHKEHNLLQDLVNKLPDVIFIKDRNSKFILANKACVDANRQKNVEDVIGKTDFDFFEKEKAQKFYEEEQKIIRTGIPLLNFEGLYTNGEGKERWRSVSKVPLMDDSGKITGLIGFQSDIDDIRKTSISLAESKKNFMNIVENMFAGVFVLNKASIIKFASAKIEEIMGRKKGSFIGEKFNIPFVPGQIKEIDIMRNSRKVGIASMRVVDTMWDGEQGYLVTIRDITESKVLEEQLKQKTQELLIKNIELEKLDKMKDEFMSNISHEMRTPLTIIKEFTSIMSDGLAGKISQQQKECLDTISESVVNLTRIISNILDLSRIEAGRMELNMKVVKLDSLIEGITSYFSSIAKKKGVRIECEVIKNLPPIFADPEKLNQIFNNLIWNAIKFTPEGGLIKISAKESDIKIEGSRGFVEISVLDTGEGIEKEDLERIFERFEQVQKPAGPRGTGLGLAITKELVNMHQGKIWVESEGIGKGSVFKFIIPRL